jgi:hypothetical protein
MHPSFPLCIVAVALSLAPQAASSQTFPEPFSYQALQDYLEANQELTTLEDVLETLPPAYKRYYAFMRESRSLQGASVEEPRVIIMTTQANLFMAFAGQHQTRSNTLEIAVFDPNARAYEFRELTFRGGRPELSEANPELCRGCHGQDPRPIWAPYPFWPGAFGEFRDQGLDGGSPETRAAETAFYDRMGSLPRYRSLMPYDQTTFYDPSDHTIQNTSLMRLLFASNFQRVSRLLQETPFYQAYKYAVMGALLCYPRSDTAPETFLRTFLPSALADAHLAAFLPEHRHDAEVGAFLYWDYLFETRGISTETWPNHSGPLDARSGNRFANDDLVSKSYTGAIGTAAAWLLHNEPEISAFLGNRIIHTDIGTYGLPHEEFQSRWVFGDMGLPEGCALLADRSREALDDVLRTTTPAEIFLGALSISN